MYTCAFVFYITEKIETKAARKIKESLRIYELYNIILIYPITHLNGYGLFITICLKNYLETFNHSQRSLVH